MAKKTEAAQPDRPDPQSKAEWIINFLLDNDLRHGAEIGVRRGVTTAAILTHVPRSTMIAIDPWAPTPEYQTVNHDRNYAKVCLIEQRFRPRLKIIRALSADAVSDVSDKSLDFVYIDAAHDYDSVLADVHLWRKKVKKNGYMIGDDFNEETFPDVVKAVKKAIGRAKLERGFGDLWFIKV